MLPLIESSIVILLCAEGLIYDLFFYLYPTTFIRLFYFRTAHPLGWERVLLYVLKIYLWAASETLSLPLSGNGIIFFIEWKKSVITMFYGSEPWCLLQSQYIAHCMLLKLTVSYLRKAKLCSICILSVIWSTLPLLLNAFKNAHN